MGKPTLYNKGSLIPMMGENKKILDEIEPIEYILNWFDKRIPKTIRGEPDILIQNPSDKVVILQSGTGSGKSTSIPPKLYLNFAKRLNKQIIITQPRVLTAIDIPKDIDLIDDFKKPNNDGLYIELYKNIGYQTQEFVQKPLEKGILFCTNGILLQFLKIMSNEDIYKKYGIIIIDEVHDRSVEIDFILYFLKQLVNKDIKKCPFIILMSATMDPYKYAKYFNTKTIFNVKGLTFPIESNFLNVNTDNVILKSINIIDSIHTNNINEIGKSNNIDIILFVHSSLIISNIITLLHELNTKKYTNNYILPISLTSEIFNSGDINYSNIFLDLKMIKINVNDKIITPVRRVIVSTNIAETGLTIKTLKYCLDIGYVTAVEYNPIYNSILLLTKPSTKAMILQRKGRVGRKQEGIWYPLFTEDTYNNLQETSLPTLFTEDVTLYILNIMIKINEVILDKNNNIIINNEPINEEDILKLKSINIYNLDLLDKIPYNIVLISLKKLYIMGAIYYNLYPTKTGLIMNMFKKIKIENIKMILSGFNNQANVSDLVTIAAYLEVGKNKIVQSKFKSFNIELDNDIDECIDYYNYNKLKFRLLISCEFIDFLIFFKIFERICYKYKNIKKIEEWCDIHKVNYNGLLKVVSIREEIISPTMIFNLGLNPYINNVNILDLLNNNNHFELIEEVKKIKKCIYNGYLLNIATYDEINNIYISDETGININVNSYLTNNFPILNIGEDFIQNKPKKIIYDSSILKFDYLNNSFEFYIVNALSVLDGYLNIDDTLSYS